MWSPSLLGLVSHCDMLVCSPGGMALIRWSGSRRLIMTWQAQSTLRPRPRMAPVWCMLPDARRPHVKPTGHSSGCSLTATRPLRGSEKLHSGVNPARLHRAVFAALMLRLITSGITEISRLIVDKLEFWGVLIWGIVEKLRIRSTMPTR